MTTAKLDLTDATAGCGCAYCQGAQDNYTFDSYDADFAVLSGGGGTVTPASIGINNAYELIDGREWGPGDGVGVSLSYSFPTSTPSYYAPGSREYNNFEAFSPVMQAATRDIMDYISTFTNVTFTEVSGNGDITLAQAALTEPDSNPTAYAYYPDQGSHSGDVWFNNAFNFENIMDPGELGYYVVLHELGHSLGLQHSFTAGLTGNENTEQFSVMAYNTSPWGNVSAETFQLYDIAAIQSIYGANTSYNSGNTNYDLDPAAAYTVWDGGGIDTFNASAQSSNVIIHLEEGGFSSVGLTENIAIAYGAVIENAIGGSGHDAIYGNAANNVLTGGAGNDSLAGGAGNDTYVYSTGIDTITETSGTDYVEFSSNWAPGDVTISGNSLSFDASNLLNFNNINLIEFFSFSGFADFTLSQLMNFGSGGNSGDDTFTGTAAAQTFDGGAGTDTVDYTASTSAIRVDLQNNSVSGGFAQGDTLISIENITGSNSSSARDYIWGNGQDNVILGLAGNDILEGGDGADILDGGAGWDYANYTRAASGITLNMETGVHTGDAAGDQLINIEAVVGSNHDDILTGDSANNYFRGGNGDDILSGGLGSDTLVGQNGNDEYIYTGGRDRIFEVNGSSSDQVTFDAAWNAADLTIQGNIFIFDQNVNTITFNNVNLIETFSFNGLADMSFTQLQAYLASLVSSEAGSNGNDTFTATIDAENFDGLGGRDTVDYSNSNAAITVDLLNNTAVGGYAAGDTFTSIEDITGSDDAALRDTIYGDNGVNYINGLNGADILEGGDGADVIDGGAGWDYSRYTRSDEGVNINLETGVNTGGDAQGDLIFPAS